MAILFPAAKLSPAPQPFIFPRTDDIALPEQFYYKGRKYITQEFLDATDTAALLIIYNGNICYEHYALTGGPDVQWISTSMAKSFISILIGIAVDEGLIGSIDDPVNKYLPELNKSSFADVPIKDILQMSSGVAWNEEDGIRRLMHTFVLGGSLNDLLLTLKRERPPGTYNLYSSANTQVLGFLLTRVSARSITDYMQEKFWIPMGMQDPAYWLLDDESMEMAYGGFNATARDYAKIGELYRLGGQWQGRQIIPADWVIASITPDAPHLIPGDNPLSDDTLGYGYHWWIIDGNEGEFSAMGLYNQFIYVNPTHQLVIVKLSANRATALDQEAQGGSNIQSIGLFRAIAQKLRLSPLHNASSIPKISSRNSKQDFKKNGNSLRY